MTTIMRGPLTAFVKSLNMDARSNVKVKTVRISGFTTPALAFDKNLVVSGFVLPVTNNLYCTLLLPLRSHYF